MRQPSLIEGHELLVLWERALPLRAGEREALLAHDEASAPPLTIGARRLRLIERLQRRIGARVPLRSRCPACGEQASFSADLQALMQALAPATETPAEQELRHGDWQLRFRLPTPAELPHDAADAEDFVGRLLERCVLGVAERGEPRSPQAVPAALLDALSQHMEALDPAAHIGFELACPACATRWSAAFDPGAALWSLLQGDAERLLLDIDALAQRYGWSEEQVLALTPTRRRAYLQLAQLT
jgi:hypothetical protein